LRPLHNLIASSTQHINPILPWPTASFQGYLLSVREGANPSGVDAEEEAEGESDLFAPLDAMVRSAMQQMQQVSACLFAGVTEKRAV